MRPVIEYQKQSMTRNNGNGKRFGEDTRVIKEIETDGANERVLEG
jgi:hypothetical protein